MYQRLLLALSVFFISCAAMAQNVMSPADDVYIYNPSAPLGSRANPTLPPTNVIAPWIRDPSQSIGNGHRVSVAMPDKPIDTIGSFGFAQNTFKAYIINGMPFRIRFPNNYNPNNATKYPVVVFFHGTGEAAFVANSHNILSQNPTVYVNRENQDQLYNGAQLFEQRINQGEWNGFLLFPQLMDNSPQWDDNHFPDVDRILDVLKQYHNADEDRIISMGLSAGGFGGANFANYHPDRAAAVVISNPRFIEGLGNSTSVSHFSEIPVWFSYGGEDRLPDPGQVMTFRDALGTVGANVYESYYPTQGHISWNTQWNSRDINNKLILSKYWNSAHKAQPTVFFQNTQFCAGQPISAKMAISAGSLTHQIVNNTEVFTSHPFYAFEWQYDGGSGFANIPGATSNTYTATQAGKYRVRFKRTSSSDFSAWTPNPIVISTKVCAPASDTAFQEHFETTPINNYIAFSAGPSGGNSAYFKKNTDCENGMFVNATEAFTQDATGRLGGRFMVNNTRASGSTQLDANGNPETITCNYYPGDMVWRAYPVSVLQNTTYSFSYYIGNQSLTPSFPSPTPLAKIVAKVGGVVLSPVTGDSANSQGDPSWKKYTYIWNSGGNTSVEIALINNTTNPIGNDFVLDEITLVKYKDVPMPGYAFKNVNLWAKAGTIQGPDSSLVSLWPNSDINGNALVQTSADSAVKPVLKNNPADNINFNPTVISDVPTLKQLNVPGGFTGNKVHNSAYVFMVNKPAAYSGTGSRWLREAVSEGSISVYTYDGGYVQWNAGDGTNSIFTPANTIDINKPTLWSFSKNNSFGTGSGNKQDIRKNGVVVGTSTGVSTLTGINDNFALGSLDGSVAEVVYLLDSNITAKTQNRIESYLALKYGTTLGTTAAPISYTASDSTTVFWTANGPYQNDVFGIGKDSLSALLQTQSNSVNSGSGDGTGQSAKGNLVVSTSAQLVDKQFLMIGNNAGSLAQHPIVSGEAPNSVVGSYRVDRKWKVYNTGTPAVGAVSLSFDTTGLQNQQGGAVVANYALMIDQDGDGNFNTGSLTFYTATSASGKKINFASAPLGNGVVFTVITLKVTALPAVWLGFTAEAVNGNAILDWKTSDEINVDRYTVEHSFNGVSFSPIGSVAANNSTGVNKYALADNNLAAGIHYYRIRRTDKDGKTEYSEIKSVKITANGANVLVRPNPVTSSTLSLSVSVQQSTKTLVQVMSVDGKVLVQRNISLASGMNTVNLNISNIPSGVYLVQVQLNDGLVTKKFIKQP